MMGVAFSATLLFYLLSLAASLHLQLTIVTSEEPHHGMGANIEWRRGFSNISGCEKIMCTFRRGFGDREHVLTVSARISMGETFLHVYGCT